MATYKLIQDIEAEDHILGPLSLRQFIFALVAAFLLYICFISIAKHVPFLLVIFLPPALFCAFFAFPFGGDQPTELWALAKLRFWFKPHKRIWNQSGIRELVTITVPKKIEHVYSDGLSQTEVKSRLQALANTIDSRGWAIKHINAVGYMPQQVPGSDRLIDIPAVPPQEVAGDLPAAADIMDAEHNPLAQQFQTMINKSNQDYRQKLVEQLKAPLPATDPASAPAAVAAPAAKTAPGTPQWFINHNPRPAAPIAAPAAAATPVPAAPAPLAGNGDAYAADDQTLAAQLKQPAGTPEVYGNLRTLQPLGSKAAPAPPPAQAPADDVSTAVTASSDPAILSLSKNNDLNVSTLAREAQRAKQASAASDEVVVSLH